VVETEVCDIDTAPHDQRGDTADIAEPEEDVRAGVRDVQVCQQTDGCSKDDTGVRHAKALEGEDLGCFAIEGGSVEDAR